MTNETNGPSDNRIIEPRPRAAPVHFLWRAATALALAAVVFLCIVVYQLSSRIADLNAATDAQISKLTDQISQTAHATDQRLEFVAQEARESAASLDERFRSEVRKAGASLSKKLADEQQTEQQAQRQVASEIDALKQAGNSVSSKLDQITGDVSGVTRDVAATQSGLQQTGSDLKRVNGDLGVMSGLIATNSKQLAELRALGDRDYLEFDLKRNAGPQKVGVIQLTLAKADPKRNRFTLDVLADDKRVEKRDRTINEPVQFYVAGSRQPCEIVVNEVKKNEVSGYLAVPKVKIARR